MNFYQLDKNATKYQIHEYKSDTSKKLCPQSINRLVLQRARDSLIKQTQLLSAAVTDEDTKQPKAKWVTHAFNNSNNTQRVATRKAKKYSKQEKKMVLAARRKEQAAILDKPRSIFDDWLEKMGGAKAGRNFDQEKLQQVKNTDTVATSDEIIQALERANMKYLPVGLKLIYRGEEATIVAAGAIRRDRHEKNYTLQTAKGMRLVKIPNRYVKIFKSQIRLGQTKQTTPVKVFKPSPNRLKKAKIIKEMEAYVRKKKVSAAYIKKLENRNLATLDEARQLQTRAWRLGDPVNVIQNFFDAKNGKIKSNYDTRATSKAKAQAIESLVHATRHHKDRLTKEEVLGFTLKEIRHFVKMSKEIPIKDVLLAIRDTSSS